jgi:replicative DNA helicase
MEQWPLYFDDSGLSDISDIIMRAKSWKRQRGIEMLIVDYLQLVSDQSVRGSNRTEIIGSVSRKLKLLSKQLEIPVIALAQLSREVEKRPNHRPQLSDLRESGSIEQDADIVEFIYRPDYYGDAYFQRWKSEAEQMTKPEKRELVQSESANTEIILEKYRSGSQAIFLLQWEGSQTNFIDPLTPESGTGETTLPY